MQPDLLSQLHDIQTPEAIGNWPLAWGWWLVIVISCAVVILTIITVYHFVKKRRAKKQALRILRSLKPTQHPTQTVQAINNVLKRVLLVYCDRDRVAKLSGEKLTIWLNKVGNKKYPIDASFTQLAYQAHCSSEQASEYLIQTTEWIKSNLPLSTTALQQANIGDNDV